MTEQQDKMGQCVCVLALREKERSAVTAGVSNWSQESQHCISNWPLSFCLQSDWLRVRTRWLILGDDWQLWTCLSLSVCAHLCERQLCLLMCFSAP